MPRKKTAKQPKKTTKPYFIDVVTRIQEELRDVSQKPKEISGPEYARLSKVFQDFSEVDKIMLIEAVVESYIRYEGIVTLQYRLKKHNLDLTTSQVDLFFWIVLKHLLRPLLPKSYEVPFFRVPESSELPPNNQTYENYSRSIGSFAPNDFLKTIVKKHFGTKSKYMFTPFQFDDIKSDYSWTIINKLVAENYTPFFEDGGIGDMPNAMQETDKEKLIREFVLTNAVSCLGRTGRPIQYYEMLFGDCRQFGNDVRTTVSATIIENGYDIVSIADSEFIVQIPTECINTSPGHLVALTQQTMRNILTNVLPSGFTPEHIDALVSPQVKCDEMLKSFF